MDQEACHTGLKQQTRLAADYFRNLPDPPTALFAVNDNVAHVFITEAEALGWSVPGDISVVGFDDIEQYSPRAPFLTTIRQPFEGIGTRAAELLLRNMEGAKENKRTFQHMLLPTKLVVRSSCRPVNSRSDTSSQKSSSLKERRR
jgi:DNA-binding LacI/PurR family transcriptional regulator